MPFDPPRPLADRKNLTDLCANPANCIEGAMRIPIPFSRAAPSKHLGIREVFP
jgi:hypothetical protein